MCGATIEGLCEDSVWLDVLTVATLDLSKSHFFLSAPSWLTVGDDELGETLNRLLRLSQLNNKVTLRA